jgi:hypothetical protein
MSEIESMTDLELRTILPQALDEDFLARLTACADGSILELTSAEIDFEQSLRATTPASLPASLHASIGKTIGDTPFHTDDKIVLFNRSKDTSKNPQKSWWSTRINIAAAAAVALLGSISAFMLPAEETSSQANNQSIISNSAPISNSSTQRKITPVGYNRNLSNTSDEGVIWQGNNRPHRVLRLTFVDRFTLTNQNGETVEVEQPRDEYVIIPEKVD